MERNGRADLRGDLAGPLSVEMMVQALGLEETDPAEALAWYGAIVAEVTAITAGAAPDGSGREAFARLCSSVEPALDRHPSSSLVAAAARTGGLTRAQVTSNAAVLLFGGIETTEAMIANAFLHLLSNPSQQALVEAEPALLAAAVEESLRLEPAAAVVDRYVTRDTELAGVPLGSGGPRHRLARGCQSRPRRVRRARPVRLRRDNAGLQVGFAHGPHVCLGMHLARLETRVALERALARLPRLRLDPARPAAARGLVFRKPPAVWALWDSAALVG